MIRSLKIATFAALLVAIVFASFAFGQQIRKLTAGPVSFRTRVSSLTGVGLVLDLSANEFGPDHNPADTFLDVLSFVRTQYVDRVTDEKKLEFGAVKTMLISLDDPQTRFLEPAQRKVLDDQLSGKFNGIGATLSVLKQKKNGIERSRLTVVAPAPNGPADQAGIKPGDVVTEIDGHWIIAYDPRFDLDRLQIANKNEKEYRKAYKDAISRLTDGITLQKALDTLSGSTEGSLKLTVERAGIPKPLALTVKPGPFTLAPVEYKAINDKVGYIRITQFNDTATTEFTQALAEAGHKSLIIDLRDNAGAPVTDVNTGSYNSVRTLLADLTDGGKVGDVVHKGNRLEAVTIPAGTNDKHKLAILMNGGTANLAEFTAAALKDKSGAALIGTRTFGDGVYQKLVDLRDGASITLRAGKYLTSKGFDFGGKGLQPDVVIAGGGPESNDAVVERAMLALAG